MERDALEQRTPWAFYPRRWLRRRRQGERGDFATPTPDLKHARGRVPRSRSPGRLLGPPRRRLASLREILPASWREHQDCFDFQGAKIADNFTDLSAGPRPAVISSFIPY